MQGPPVALTEGHQFSTTLARFLADGRRAVTAGIDGQVCVWDVDTGRQRARLPETGVTAAVAVSPDDEWILTGSNDQAVQLWKLSDAIADFDAGRPTKPAFRFAGHDFQIRTLAVAPDGSGRFYSGDQNGIGRLWNLNDWQAPPIVLAHHTGRVNAAAFFPDGRQFATASDDGFVCICDTATGTIRQKLDHRSQCESVVALGVTPDGRRAISLGEPGSETEPFVIFDWNTETGELRQSNRFAVGLTVFGIVLSPNAQSPGALLAVGQRGESGTELRGWDLQNWREQSASDGRQILSKSVVARNHATVWSAAWSPDGSRLLTAGGSEAQVWNPQKREATMQLGPHRAVASAGFSSDGRFVVTGSWDGTFKVWSVAEGRSQVVCRVPVLGSGAVNSVAFSPRAACYQILSAHDDGLVCLWDWDPATPEILPRVLCEYRHQQTVNAAVFSPDGQFVLTLCDDSLGRVWDTAPGSRKPVFELAGQHTGRVLCGAFSPDGRWIATSGQNRQIMLWNARTGEPALESPWQGHSADIVSLALSEHGDRLLTGSRDGTAKLWDLRTRDSDASPNETPAVGDPDSETDAEVGGEEPAATESSNRLRVTELLTLRGHSKEISSVSFSPDGRFVLTASLDGSAIVWLANGP